MIPIKHIPRFREIITILFRHGLGWLIVEMGLGKIVPFHWGLLGHPKRKTRYSAEEHLRMAFEELGPTFIKLAQILSTRPDLISPTYAAEFSRLQDQAPAVPFTDIQPIIESELKSPISKIFADFQTTPIASASIGQVYRACLKNGQQVVVKVQKPNTATLIQQDMEILRTVVEYMEVNTPLGEKYDLKGLFEEFNFTLHNELDYIREGQNADRFRSLFNNDPHIHIPQVFWEWSTSRLLVMEEITGIKVTELNTKELPFPINRHRLAEIAVALTFKEIFEYGFYHADPHPGNFVIMDNEKLGLMDFGLVGYLEENTRNHFLHFAYAMVTGNLDDMLDAMWTLGIQGPFESRPALKRDLNHLLFRVKDKSMKELAAADIIHELMGIAYRHQLHFPPDLALLFKVLAMSEGLGAMFDPDFKLFEFAQPYLQQLTKKLYSPQKVAEKVTTDLVDLLILGHGLPKRASYLLQRLENNDIQFRTSQPRLEQIGLQVITAINRLTISIIISLILIALGLYILAGHFMGFNFYLVNVFLGLLVIGGIYTIRIIRNIRKQNKFFI